MSIITLFVLWFGLQVNATEMPTTPISSNYPVTVDSCGKKLTFDQAPTRAVFNDLNMVEMALELDLQPNMAAVSGISGWYKTTPEFKKALGNIPEISPRYLALEPLIHTAPDFLFAGWNYGLRVGTELVPENFEKFNIKTLELSESCVHINSKNKTANMDLLYDDMMKLGQIFNVTEKAQSKIQNWKKIIENIHEKTNEQPKKKVFLFDSGVDKPLTSGRYAMPQALIDAAGGKNIMDDADYSWSNSSWEQVAMADPEMIILVDYHSDGAMNPKQLKDVLNNHPLMKHTQAVKNENYLLLSYGEITPGPGNIKAIQKIAQKLYPEIKF